MVSSSENDVPIRDASTVILIRKKDNNNYVLMGQRGRNAAFMPSKYVFPGGAVDPQDSDIELVGQLSEKVSTLLQSNSKNNISNAHGKQYRTVEFELMVINNVTLKQKYHLALKFLKLT